MNWLKKRWIFNLGVLVAAAVVAGCGVKGDPLPPVPPVEMGRGRPTYRRATQHIKIEKDEATDEEKH